MLIDPNDLLSETQIQSNIEKWARDNGWLVYHTKSSKLSEPGFPDLIMVRWPQILAVEVKTTTGKVIEGRQGKTRYLPGQEEWIKAFDGCDTVWANIVRPNDLLDLYERLI